ncbi:hypothetical protein ACQEVB_17050 [Pseudonocardia sp. CA-107938]|uniref:hypothetical protein n=1 Tax=Pseudonocardia sp. CA-107938 TaxID=3240021 RepID=UPI003D91F414
MISARRRTARVVAVTLTVICVLAGAVPTATEIARQGLSTWASTETFREGRTADD